ncbi:hypothetical protein [Haliea sp.]|jgi:hypothetical protein|uniref:hypothetical protein n=1 Tax=Haliea sp. TaxID=1932666 RepID=UPI00257A221E|nr:hypothetical protein [Haliea sp.]|tara:strand:+ start:3005 stop:3595 length:591 start_codon:yes stop_codon:yes gene_type:complete
MLDTYFVTIEMQAGEYQKTIRKLVRATSPKEADEKAIEGECHGSLEDGTAEWTSNGISDLGYEFHYKSIDCKKVQPEHEVFLRLYFDFSIVNNNTEESIDEFDTATWCKLCDEMGEKALKGCGLSHDHMVTLFSESVDKAISDFPLQHQALAILIARGEGYLSISERKEQQDWLADNGYCSHGIERDACPSGCGDV